MTKRKQITVEEKSGTQFPDLHTAQRSARLLLAADLAQIVKRMIAQGDLVILDNQIIPKGK